MSGIVSSDVFGIFSEIREIVFGQVSPSVIFPSALDSVGNSAVNRVLCTLSARSARKDGGFTACNNRY